MRGTFYDRDAGKVPGLYMPLQLQGIPVVKLVYPGGRRDCICGLAPGQERLMDWREVRNMLKILLNN